MTKSKLYIFKFLLEKEFKQLFRNKFLPRLIMLFPVAILLFLPWAATMEVRNIHLSVLDNDKTAVSKQLIEKIGSSGYFIITQNAMNIKDAMVCIENNKCDIILEIPSGFEKNLFTAKHDNVGVYANAINSVKGSIGSGYLAGIINDFSDTLRYDTTATIKVNLPINISSQYFFNPMLEYKVFMIPAFMVILLSLLCGYLPALNIVAEKESGSIEQINVTPVGRFAFIMSKLIPYWIVGFVVLTICFILAYLIYGLIPQGNIFLVYFFSFLFVLSVAGFGLVISNYSNTLQQAMFVMYFFMLTLMLTSGMFTPVSSMPDWAQLLMNLNFLKYFVDSIRFIYLKGSPFISLLPQFFALLIFAVLFNVWAVISYKKRG